MFWWLTKKNIFLTVSWLSGLLSAEIFISTGEWGVQMPPLTSENSYFLRSGPQGATLVMGPINNIPALVQIMAWRQLGDKPLSEAMMVLLLTHICVTRPQWVKCLNACKPHLRTTQRWPQMVNSVQISGGGNQLTYPCVLVALMQRYNSLTYDKTLWKFFTTHYKLQITRFQMTKFVWNAFNINPKRIICQIACSILSQE